LIADINTLGRTQGKHLLAVEKSGPAFDALTPYQQGLEDGFNTLRRGFAILREADTGRPLSIDEQRVCDEQAAIAMRRRDPDCYEDDKGDAVGKTVEYFRGRSIDASEAAIREIAMEACSFLRAVEAKR
jgi:hypothetical protein